MGSERHQVTPIVLMILQRPDGKICLGKRKGTKNYDGFWTMPSGHVELGESFKMGAIRETMEEAGLNLDPKDVRLVVTGSRKWQENPGENIELVFYCNAWQGDVINAEPHKCAGWEWFDPTKLPDPTISSEIDYINAFLAGKNYLEIAFDDGGIDGV